MHVTCPFPKLYTTEDLDAQNIAALPTTHSLIHSQSIEATPTSHPWTRSNGLSSVQQVQVKIESLHLLGEDYIAYVKPTMIVRKPFNCLSIATSICSRTLPRHLTN
jgi:hypothetical protein